MLSHPCSVDVKERLRVLLMTVGVKERQVQSQVDAVIDIAGEGAAYVNEEQFMTWWRSVRDEENKANPLGTSVPSHTPLWSVTHASLANPPLAALADSLWRACAPGAAG